MIYYSHLFDRFGLDQTDYNAPSLGHIEHQFCQSYLTGGYFQTIRICDFRILGIADTSRNLTPSFTTLFTTVHLTSQNSTQHNPTFNPINLNPANLNLITPLISLISSPSHLLTSSPLHQFHATIFTHFTPCLILFIIITLSFPFLLSYLTSAPHTLVFHLTPHSFLISFLIYAPLHFPPYFKCFYNIIYTRVQKHKKAISHSTHLKSQPLLHLCFPYRFSQQQHTVNRLRVFKIYVTKMCVSFCSLCLVVLQVQVITRIRDFATFTSM